MQIKPLRQEGYELMHDGALELARIEANGIRIDVPRLNKTKVTLTETVRSLKAELEGTAIWRLWRRRFGGAANITSGDQLGVILYEVLGFPVLNRTESGQPSTDEEALQKMDQPDLPKLIRLGKYQKALGTYLKGIEREIVGDRIHPVFNLHFVRSFRSSSDSPNFQNQPVRDKEMAEIIRSLFIASPNSVITENDFKGIEVSLSASYHHDPVFIDYVTTPGKDMHRDMAAQIYCLEPGQVSKDARYGAKNKFVFPQFYGDYYLPCARNLWDWIERGKLKGPKGEPLKEHLKTQGIKGLGRCDPEQKPLKGTFEHHLQEVENDFWNNRFKAYGQWRRDWYREYLDKGYFDILTGFRVHGNFGRNAVTNYPVQGSAFHCLLWSLIIVNKKLRKYNMHSLIVGQIHDSLVGDIRESELRDYLSLVEETVSKGLPAHWDWLAVPPQIECEIAPPGESWFKKTEVLFKNGRFGHPEKSGKFTADPQKLFEIIEKRKTKI